MKKVFMKLLESFLKKKKETPQYTRMTYDVYKKTMEVK